ncbi:hypothetical protein [Micromonospora deserti]|nr:hypothetical protein [Micromonospora deserti]
MHLSILHRRGTFNGLRWTGHDHGDTRLVEAVASATATTSRVPGSVT